MSQKVSILIAEDNPDHCELLELELKRGFGECDLLFAETGEELIRFLRASPELPDLILLDIKMPRMNGIETISAIKRVDAWRNIPIFITSTSASEADVEACLDMGAACYLTKPLHVDLLLECLERA